MGKTATLCSGTYHGYKDVFQPIYDRTLRSMLPSTNGSSNASYSSNRFDRRRQNKLSGPTDIAHEICRALTDREHTDLLRIMLSTISTGEMRNFQPALTRSGFARG